VLRYLSTATILPRACTRARSRCDEITQSSPTKLAPAKAGSVAGSVAVVLRITGLLLSPQ